MKQSIFKSRDELPMFLTVMDVANLLGISRASAYELAREENVEVCYHLFLDGRDVNPKSSYTYIKQIEDMNYGKICTISGRYYAMDRDNNFDRLKKAYDAIVYGVAPRFNTPKGMIETSYKEDITDEFVIPGIINDGKFSSQLFYDSTPVASISSIN